MTIMQPSKTRNINSFSLQVCLVILCIIICELLYFFANKLLADKLNSSDYGHVFTCFSAIEFLGATMLLGVDIILIRELPFLIKTNWNAASSIILQTRLFLKKMQIYMIILTGTVCLFGLLFKASLIDDVPFMFILYLFPCCTWYYKYQILLISIGRFILAAVMDVGQKLIFLLFSLNLIFWANKINAVYFILLASFSLAASYLLISKLIKRHLLTKLSKMKISMNLKGHSAINFVRDSPSYAFQRLGAFGFNSIPMLIYELFSHDNNGGILATIIVITSLLSIPLRALSTTISPQISLALRSGAKDMRSRLLKIRIINVTVVIISISLFIPFADVLLYSLDSYSNLSYYCLILWLIGPLLYGATAGGLKVIQFSPQGKLYGNLVWIIVLSWQAISCIIGSRYWGLKGIVYANITTNIVYFSVIILVSRIIILSNEVKA